MRKIKIFISSVQVEFAEVRAALAEYLYSDALLGKFFEPFLFEQLPAVDNMQLEIWNPGSLPFGWTIQKLKKLHSSVPANPLLAEPLYLAGYIERLGTGTADIIRIAKECGLKEPEFVQHDDFKIIIYRKQASGEVTGEVSGEVTGEATGEVTGQVTGQPTGQVTGQPTGQPKVTIVPNVPKIVTGQPIGQPTGQVTGQPTGQPTVEVLKVILVLEGEMKLNEIMSILSLKHREYFTDNYIEPAIKQNIIEQTYPESPNHPQQRYKLTEKGMQMKLKIKNKK